MPSDKNIYLNDVGIVCALGSGKAQVFENMVAAYSPGMKTVQSPIRNIQRYVGQVEHALPAIPAELDQFDCRNNRLAQAALSQLTETIERCKDQYGAGRIGVVVGTSTSGIGEAELAIQNLRKNGRFPADYHYKKQEIGAVAEFVAQLYGINGPAYVISTACSSSGKVFASARSLIQLDICDVVILGGVDSLCELTLSGFASLEAISSDVSNPFSENRCGINIGEAAAFFIMTREPAKVALLGVGESSDAYHMSAPEPSGKGAISAMMSALSDAELVAEEIDYINLHGTGTSLNDSMESHAVFSVFGEHVQASSSKPLTGHTLGAAGAVEAAISWLLLTSNEDNYIVPHIYDGQFDKKLSKISLCESNRSKVKLKRIMSNSFAFGGNNVSVILGTANDK